MTWRDVIDTAAHAVPDAAPHLAAAAQLIDAALRGPLPAEPTDEQADRGPWVAALDHALRARDPRVYSDARALAAVRTALAHLTGVMRSVRMFGADPKWPGGGLPLKLDDLTAATEKAPAEEKLWREHWKRGQSRWVCPRCGSTRIDVTKETAFGPERDQHFIELGCMACGASTTFDEADVFNGAPIIDGWQQPPAPEPGEAS